VTANLPGQALAAASTLPGGLLGMAIQASNFAAVLEFLGTQGNVQVLSSPRIATMNNQKAVLKVGTDDFFVTNISTTTSSTGNTSQTSPNITVQPFFSGIALDVTPHIDDQGFIVLHVHPAVSNVGERNKVLNLGSLGSFTLPLASSDVSETDSVVRARDGKIIAIGGLMRTESRNGSSGLPGLGNGPLRSLLGGRTETVTDKRELVILLKPTIVDPSQPDAGRSDPLARVEQLLREGEVRALPADRGTPRAAATVPAPAATVTGEDARLADAARGATPPHPRAYR
jgi:MSHA biogenesis protein MshL